MAVAAAAIVAAVVVVVVVVVVAVAVAVAAVTVGSRRGCSLLGQAALIQGERRRRGLVMMV